MYICVLLQCKTKEIVLQFIQSHCIKGVRIRSFSGWYSPAFGLNMEVYSVNLCIQSECGKIRSRKTPNTDTFHALSATFLYTHPMFIFSGNLYIAFKSKYRTIPYDSIVVVVVTPKTRVLFRKQKLSEL